MTRPAAHALWRAAPLRLARTPGWGALVLVAAVLFVAAVVAPTLFVEAARSTALVDGLAATRHSPYGEESGDLRVTWDGVVRDDAPLLEPLSRMSAYGEPTLTASGVAESTSTRPVAVANGVTSTAVLWYHDGALAALGGDPDTDGVWLAGETARELGVRVGDHLRIGTLQTFLGNKLRARDVVLAGVYETAPGSTLPTALAGLPDADRWFLPTDPALPQLGRPLAIVGKSTFNRLVPQVRETPLYLADLLLDPHVTPDGASHAVDLTERYADDAFDATSDVFDQLSSAKPAPAILEVISGLPAIAEQADRTATSARQQVQPYAVAGQVLAGLLLVAAQVLLGLSRRREQLLASGLGLHPLRLAALTALEVLPVCLVAVPAGVALAHLGVVAAGPPVTDGLPVAEREVVRAAVGAAVCLLLLAATTGVAALATDRLDRLSRLGRGRVAVPWATGLVVVTAVVGFAVVTVDTADRSSARFVTAFPLLVMASTAMLVVRGAAWVRSRRATRARPGTPRWLAARRTGPVVREVTALAAVVAIALGLFAYTVAVRRGIDEGVADKTAALIGSSTTLEVDQDLRGQGADHAVQPPVDGTTVVWRRGVSLPPDFGEIPLMAIDPGSFGDVADWGASGDLDAGRDLLPRLLGKERGLPVILAGDTRLEAGDQTVLELNFGFTAPVFVVGVVAAFPGSEAEPGKVTVVMDSRRLFRLLPPLIDPRRRGADRTDPGSFTSVVWSRGSADALRARLEGAHIATDGVVDTATAARVENGLVASTWAAGYVLAIGGVVLVLALAAGLVLARRLADRDTVSDVLLRRMGYRPGELARARAWEVGYAVGTALVAAVLGVAALVLAPTMIDAAAVVPPLSRPRPAAVDALPLVGVLVALVLLAWLAGAVRTRRRSAAEVLRAGG